MKTQNVMKTKRICYALKVCPTESSQIDENMSGAHNAKLS